MADYELGTAHGRIVVDYDDRGIAAAEKDLDSLQRKARDLLSRLGALARDWRKQGNSMRETAAGAARGVGAITAVALAAHTAMHRFGASFGLLQEARSLVSELGTALGAVPAGMENFPSAVQRVVRLNAAVAVLTGTLGLLARSTAGLRGIRVVTGLLGTFGASIRVLAGPLRLVSTLAFGFVTAIKAFKLIKQTIALVPALNLVLYALGGTVQIVSGLAASIRDLSKAALLLPGIIGAGALAFGTFKIATQGVGDALKAMGDPAAFAEALKKLSPAAREAVIGIKALEPAFKKLQQSVQQKFFEGLGPITGQLGALYLPKLRAALEAVAGSFNRTIKEVAAFFNTFEGSTEAADDFAEGLGFSAKAIDNLVKAVEPLTRAFYILWRAGPEVFAEITGGAGAAAERFAQFIKSARASGDLARWMREGYQAVKDLIVIVMNLGRILTTVFDGLNGGPGRTFLGFLRDATTRMLAFLKSAEGQRALATFGAALDRAYQNGIKLADAFMKYMMPAIEAFLPFVSRLTTAVSDGLVAAMIVLGPIFRAIGEALSYLAPIIGPIVTVLVFLTTTFIGLAIAAGIIGKALLILRAGFLLIRGAVAIVSGIFRLLTGNLGPVGRAVLALARFLGGALLGALRTIGPWLKLLKMAGVVGAIMAVIGALEGYTEAQNKALADGDFGKDVKTSWEDFKSQPFEAIGKEFRASLTPPPTLNAGLAMMGAKIKDFFTRIVPESAAKVKESFQRDFMDVFAALPGKVGTFLAQTGTKISTSFQTDFIAPIVAFPDVVGTALATFGTMLYTKASEAWEQFKTATNAKFVELGGTVGSLPYRLGVALGSLIGMGLKWATDPWESFKTTSMTKINEAVVFVQGLPARTGAALVSFGTTLVQKATEAWESFKTSSKTKADEAVNDAKAIPGKVGTALSNFGNTLRERASTAWENFKATARAKIDQATADVRAFPAKAGAALASLGGILLEKARSALQSFQTGVTSGTNTALAFIRGIPGRITAAIGNLGNLLVGAGRAVISGLLSGIRSAVQGMYDFVSGIAAGIAARKGPVSYDKKLLIPAGNAIIRGLTQGMQQQMPAPWKMIAGINTDLSGIGAATDSFNLKGSATAAAATAGAMLPVAASMVPKGSDGASAPTQTFTTGKVEIPAKDLAEMKSVTDFSDAVQQKARAGKASG